MGKYNKGILGHFMGKVGNVVGSVWNGVHYMRSLGDYTDNPTTAQLNARAKVSVVMPFLADAKSIINLGWASKEKKGLTAMNAASSYHLKNAVTGVAPDFEMDFSKVLLSVGNLDELELPEMETAVGGKLVFSWVQGLNMEFGKPTDKVSVAVYNPLLNRFTIAKSVADRSALTYTMQLPMAYVGDTVEAFIIVMSADGKMAGMSHYFGSVVVV